jgi:hypothetical protein
MFWADSVGLAAVRDRMLEFRRRTGRDSWTPAPRLERLAAAGRGLLDR